MNTAESRLMCSTFHCDPDRVREVRLVHQPPGGETVHEIQRGLEPKRTQLKAGSCRVDSHYGSRGFVTRFASESEICLIPTKFIGILLTYGRLALSIRRMELHGTQGRAKGRMSSAPRTGTRCSARA